jgi:hypothetical protein
MNWLNVVIMTTSGEGGTTFDQDAWDQVRQLIKNLL